MYKTAAIERSAVRTLIGELANNAFSSHWLEHRRADGVASPLDSGIGQCDEARLLVRPTRAAVLALLVFQSSQVARAQERPVVKVSDWEQAGNGTGVHFVSLPTLTESNSAQTRLPDQTTNGLFQYGIDTTELRWAEDCRCFRYYVINVRSSVTGLVTRHKFKALPSGTFDDQSAQKMILTISEGGRSDTDDIALPVGSAPGLQPQTLQVASSHPLESVSLAGATELHLTIHNNGGMPVVISVVSVVPDQSELWAGPPSLESAGMPLSLAAHGSGSVKVIVTPQTRRAIGVSWPPTDSTQNHTTFAVEVLYDNPKFQNRQAQVSLVVPIRFQPNLFALAVALAVGVGLGSLVLLWTKRVTWWRPWLRAVMTALAVGVILELAAMLLAAKDSKFVLFGFSLDPWQTVPVILLGAGVGLLGLKSADQLNKVFKW
jgi:hypothetical protein